MGFRLGNMLARRGEHLFTVGSSKVVEFNAGGRAMRSFARPFKSLVLGISDDQAPIFSRFGFTSTDKRIAFGDPAYAPIGVWGPTVVSRVAPNEIALSAHGRVQRVVPFPKKFMFVAAALDERRGTLAMLLTRGDSDGKALFVLEKSDSGFRMLTTFRSKVLDTIEFTDGGDIVALCMEEDHPTPGNSFALQFLDSRRGVLVHQISGLRIDPPFGKPLAYLKNQKTIFIRKDAHRGYLLRSPS